MRWTVHGEHTLHDTPWVRLRSLDVTQPDGTRGDYHVVRLRDVAVTAAVDDRRRVLMMWRHRFVTDTWAWELPMGLVEDGESPQAAAARELEEETGWRPGTMRELIYAQPAAGIMDSRHFVFRTDDARHMGEPTERNESDKPAWIPLADVPGMIARREIVSSATLVGVMALLLPGTAT
ncbi:NUDIX hydrolase [Streptomyces neyagawaensis]|uniref:NUDIX domain-containing protein n=1 Tax=Streptomyces neyagawaensis TaxID=42238 RepID=A0ABV3B211_9ACTN